MDFSEANHVFANSLAIVDMIIIIEVGYIYYPLTDDVMYRPPILAALGGLVLTSVYTDLRPYYRPTVLYELCTSACKAG